MLLLEPVYVTLDLKLRLSYCPPSTRIKCKISELYYLYYLPRRTCSCYECGFINICPEAEFIRTISFWFLCIILRVLRLEVSVWISQIVGKGVWFSIRFSSFLLCRNWKRLREFEGNGNLNRKLRGDCEQQVGKLLLLLSGFRDFRQEVGLRSLLYKDVGASNASSLTTALFPS